ncbi:MAG TPA: CHAT domain-containing protein [Terriglobales bacterium]|jgi:CHAT domain-containing protein|nr:CHAT domain-containing protein [Terriglobales bacterium]
MAYRHKLVVLLAVAAGLFACNRSSQPAFQPAPQIDYDALRLRVEHGELAEAQAEADRAYQRFAARSPDLAGRVRVLEAEIFLLQGMNKQALKLLEPELPVALATDEIAVRRKILQSQVVPPFPDGKRSLDEAERLALSSQPKMLGEVELRRGSLHLRTGSFSEAETSFQNALRMARRESQPYVEAAAQTGLGYVAMKQGRYGEAIDRDKTALAFSQSLGYRVYVVKITGNLGACYHKLGDLDAALELFTKVEAMSAELGLQSDDLSWLVSIGNIHYDRHEFEQAQSYYWKAFEMAKDFGNQPEQVICLSNLAVVAIETRQFDDAERYNREFADLLQNSPDRSSKLYFPYNQAKIAMGRAKLPEAEMLLQQVIDSSGEDISLRWLAHAKLASVYATLKQPVLADQQFRESLTTINQVRASLDHEEYKLTFLSSLIDFYDDYVAFLVSQGQLKEALYVVELNRARTLSEGLQLKQGGDSFVSANFSPEQTARHTGTVVLSYWLAPEHSYLWAVTASRIEMYVLPPESEIEQAVHSYRAALAGPRDVRETQNASGQRLYEMLVAPAEKLIPSNSRVIIIPSGSLYELNFETLLVPGNQLHYWIEDVIVTNASSLLLLEKAAFKRPLDEKNILLMGDAVSPNPEYTALPQAASEIDQVRKYFPADKVQVYERQTATAKAYVEGNPGRFSIIHFVAHGVASRESPLDSAVILSGDENSYKLYAREIIKIPLHANLVTISSCQGAAGRTYAGEGLVGLSWAFLRAGAHQVIAALWEVNDASTPQFMDQFYAGVSAGSDPAVALRAAKLAMLHSDSVYRRPFYWAPFQLYKGL